MSDTTTTNTTGVTTDVDLSAIGVTDETIAADPDINAQLEGLYQSRSETGDQGGGEGGSGDDTSNDAGDGTQTATPQTPPVPGTDAPASPTTETGTGSGAPPTSPEAPGGETGGATADQPGGDGADGGVHGGADEPEGGAGAPLAAEIQWGGQKYTDDDMADMVQLKMWRTSLTPQATAAVDAVLVGTHVVVPRETAQRWAQIEQKGAPAGGFPDPALGVQPGVQQYAQPGQPFGAPPAPQPQQYAQPQPYGAPVQAPQPSAQADPFAGIDLTALDPEVVTALRAQHAATQTQMAQVTQQFDQVRQYMEGQTQVQMAQQQQAANAQVTTGIQTFMGETGFDQVTSDGLLRKVGELQILPRLVDQYNGDIAQATRDALTQVAWLDPTARQAMAAKDGLVSTTEAAQVQARRAKAASLSGGGGSVPRPGVGPGNAGGGGGEGGGKMSRTQEMAAAIAAAQQDGVPG